MAGNQPVGRVADDTDAHSLQRSPGFLDPGQCPDPPGDIAVASMKDLPFQALLLQVRENLEGSGQGIAFPGGQQEVSLDSA